MYLVLAFLLFFMFASIPGGFVLAQNSSVLEPTASGAVDPAASPEVPPADTPVSGSEQEVVDTAPGSPSTVSFAELGQGLPASVQNCAVYMGAQAPKDTEFECDRLAKECDKSQGHLPVYYSGANRDSEQEEEEEPLMDITLADCVAQCTIARRCNYITYKIATNATGECHSYAINADCHLDQDDVDCLVPSSEGALGLNLGNCDFSAQPGGGFKAAGWALFRRVRSSTSDGLAIAASVLTIMTALLGAPCTVLSHFFKA